MTPEVAESTSPAHSGETRGPAARRHASGGAGNGRRARNKRSPGTKGILLVSYFGVVPTLDAIQMSWRVRPLRVGYQVDPVSERDLNRAIETATSQWGGMFHPLIPAFRRRPPWWHLDHIVPKRGEPGAREIEKAYRDAFSCDFVVDARSTSTPSPARYGTITFQDLRQDVGDEGVSGGMPAAAVYRQLWAEEFRWEARRRPEVVVPIAEDKSLSAFIGACFGRFASRGDLRSQRDEYERLFDAKERRVARENYLDGFAPVAKDFFLTPLRMTMHGLTVGRRRRFHRIEVVVVDSSAPTDVLDLWNLRASGNPVIPVPLAWVDDLVPELARRLRDLPPSRDRWGDEIGVLGCRRVPGEAVQAVRDEIAPGKSEVFISHYPAPGTELGAVWVKADEGEGTATRQGPRFVFPLKEPTIAEHYPWTSVRWMTVINYLPWALPRDGSVAGLLPAELGDTRALFGHWAHSDVRAAREGLLVASGVPNNHFDFEPPSGEQVVSALLTGDPGGARPTEPGRIATQMIKQIGGLFVAPLLQRGPLVELFNSAATGGLTAGDETDGRPRPTVRFIRQPRLQQLIKQIHPENERARANVMRALTERDVLRAGLHLDCDHCHFPNWIELADIDTTIKCERCLEPFPFPQHDPPALKQWAYRPTGAFSVGDYARGSYSAVFALRFLTEGMSGQRSTWCTALELDDENEIDFAVLLEDDRYDDDHTVRLLLGEAKSHNRFEPRDLARAARLQKRFPRATMVFATLRKELTEDEKQGLIELARPKAHDWRHLAWHPQVMVLTELELLSDESPPECWRAAGGRAADLSHHAEQYVRDAIPTWVDITLQLHLGLGPHHEWWRTESQRLRNASGRRRGRSSNKRRGP